MAIASGEKAKARDILAAIRALQHIEHERRSATPQERQALSRFAGFGPVALSIFPDPLTDKVYTASPYDTRGERDVRNASDAIYRNGGSRSMLTLAKSGSGYVARITMGVHRT